MSGTGYLFFRKESQEKIPEVMALEYELYFLTNGKAQLHKVDNGFMEEENLPMLETPNGVHYRGIQSIESHLKELREQAFSSR